MLEVCFLLSKTSTSENEHFFKVLTSAQVVGNSLVGTVLIWTLKWCQVIGLFIYALVVFSFCPSYQSPPKLVTLSWCNYFWHLELLCHSDLCSVILIIVLQCSYSAFDPSFWTLAVWLFWVWKELHWWAVLTQLKQISFFACHHPLPLCCRTRDSFYSFTVMEHAAPLICPPFF